MLAPYYFALMLWVRKLDTDNLPKKGHNKRSFSIDWCFYPWRTEKAYGLLLFFYSSVSFTFFRYVHILLTTSDSTCTNLHIHHAPHYSKVSFFAKVCFWGKLNFSWLKKCRKSFLALSIPQTVGDGRISFLAF